MTTSFKNLIDLLQKRAESNQEKVLYTFLLDGEDEEDHLSYLGFDFSSRTLGALLQKEDAKGERALLLYPPGLDYIRAFFGCLYAGVVAVPAYPPDPGRLNRTLPRLLSIIKDSQAKYVLTTSAIKDMAEFLFLEAPELKELEWISTDFLSSELASEWKKPDLSGEDLAFLQYTSGSTGESKGVMVSHGNLLHNLEILRVGCGLGPYSQGVSWLPPYHDMGLIAGIIEPLYADYPLTLFSPLDFLQKPLRWLKAVSKYKATMTGGPNFAYDLCVRKATPEFIQTLDLSSWDLASSGAEPVQTETMQRFYETFKSCGFRLEAFSPSYGLAENTLMVAVLKNFGPAGKLSVDKRALEQHQVVEASSSMNIVSCGQCPDSQKVRIIHPESTEILPEGKVGEIWVAGPSVAKGYWNKAEKNKEVFQAYTQQGEGPFLRTGDLGFLKDGNLFITGRLKDLIIVRGAKHYPQDIEYSLEKCELPLRFGCGAVFSVPLELEEGIVVVWEVDSKKMADISYEELFQKIRQTLAQEHEVKVHAIVLLKKGEIPKTSSGKIQRHAAKEAFLKNSFDSVAEWKEEAVAISDKNQATFAAERDASTQGSLIQTWLIQKLAEKIHLSSEEIDPTKPFTFYGLDSKDAVGVSGELEQWLGKSLPPTLLWQYPNIQELAKYLSGQGITPLASIPSLSTFQEPIAIVGISCRFPGANSPEAFWNLLKNGVDAITEIPPERWNVDAFYDPQGAHDKMNTRWGGFLEKVEEFDTRFFGISPREAARMDPQQRLLLETSWEALENAGLRVDSLGGSNTGVFMGIGSTDYQQLQSDNGCSLDAYVGTGNAHSIAANRISYLFNFKGPSLAIDTACSSSLVALHLAVQSLRQGESHLALAGGINLILKPETTIIFSQARMMSSKGRCFTFDADADGYVRSEGCGVVVLKRYSDALKEGDRILALVLGTATNQDGKSNGLTAPNGKAQEEVIEQSLKQAQVSPGDLSYFEAHGTGTPLGDPIEIQSISNAIKKNRKEGDNCWIASVKTNVGHMEVASGMAGLMKVVLSLQNKQIPPHLHFKKINPYIPIDEMPLKIPLELTDWESSGKNRIAGINSFGFGGTNVSVILQETPSREVQDRHDSMQTQVLKFSAKSETGLRKIAEKYSQSLRNAQEISSTDFAYSSNVGRSDFEHRAFLIFASKEELEKNLQLYSKGQNSSVMASRLTSYSKPKLAFLFTGQGSQYPGMAKELYQQEVLVRKIFDQAQEILKSYFESPLLKILFDENSEPTLIHETAYTQPALFVLEYALAELWRSWGIEAEWVMGHSIGEYVAASYAGVMSWEEALKLVAERGRLMQSLPKNGLMAVIGAPEALVTSVIAPFHQEVAVAGVNGPKNVVISGKKERVESLVKYFSAQNIYTQVLTVSHAFHSPLMDPILEEFEKKAETVLYQEPRIKLISNLTGAVFEPGQKPNATYWKNHLRGSVKFYQGMESLFRENCEVFLEVGPEPHLSSMGRTCEEEGGHTWIWSLKKGREDRVCLLDALGKLYLKGLAPKWSALYPEVKPSKISIPTYPFEREKYWALDASSKNRRVDFEKEIHPLLGIKIDSPFKESQFVQKLQLDNLPYLKDHRVKGEIVFPGAAYVETLLAAGHSVYEGMPLRICDLQMKEALFLEDTSFVQLGTLLAKETKNESSAQILTREAKSQDGSWKEHVSARLQVLPKISIQEQEKISVEVLGMESINRASFYQQLHALGLQYGPSFQALKQIFVNKNEAFGFLHLSEEVTGSAKKYFLHPALLDAGFQLVAAFVAHQGIQDSIYLPSAIQQFDFFEKCPSEGWVRVRGVGNISKNSKKLKFDLDFIHPDGRLLIQLKGFEITALDSHIQKESGDEKGNDEILFYELDWTPQVLNNPKPLPLDGNWLCFLPQDSRFEGLVNLMKKQGAQITEVRNGDDFTNHFKGSSWRGVLYAWEEESLMGFFHCIKNYLESGMAPAPFYLLTQNTQSVENNSVNLAQAPLWGFARSLTLEHPEIFCKRIDCSDISQENEAILQELALQEGEDQVVLRKNKRFVARLKSASSLLKQNIKQQTLIIPSEGDYRLEIEEAGTLEGVSLKPIQISIPQPKEIQVKVFASALNFSDVLKVLDLYPGLGEGPVPIGIEFAGRVVAVGKEVLNYKVGDEVLGVAPFSFGSCISTQEELLVHKPSHISFKEAATLPIAYLTAHYALNHLGRMRRGEKILIHAGAGGVGIAAIHLAKMAGLEIFSTAGSLQKREFLKNLGVDHVLDSRRLDFAEEIMKITQGKGVDLVLNSLAGDFIPKSISVLGAYGRFLEIGKIDIYQNSKVGLLPFQNNLSYFAIDLDRVLRERPEWIKVFLDELMDYLREDKIKPLPYTDFSIENSVQAFRYMAQRKNIGKVLVSLPDSTASVSKGLNLWKQDGTYLITGGLGGLGLELAQWMHKTGAQALALLGRSAPSVTAQGVIDKLRQQGCQVEVYCADVSKKEALEQVFKDLRQKKLTLRGVFHAAGLLRDGIILKQNIENFDEVLAPKIKGALNLHELTQEESLDYFVMFSSLASLMGSPGQSNYAAANAFLDALAHERRAKGMPALSVQWGPWAEVGMAAKAQNEAKQSAQGLKPLSLEKGFASLEKVLQEYEKPEVVIADIQWHEMSKLVPKQLSDYFLSDWIREKSSSSRFSEKNIESSKEFILSLEGEERKTALVRMIQERVAKVLGIAPSALSVDQALNTLGLDSLMAIEMKNDIEAKLKTNLPILFLLKGPSIVQLADYLIAQMLNVVPLEAVPSEAAPLEAAPPEAAPPEKVSAETNSASWVH